MKVNPVYKREITVNSRSIRLPLILMVFNGILALVALLNMYSMTAQVEMTAEIQYGSFLELYAFASGIEFVMILMVVPALTAGSISGERERQTLELLLSTQAGGGEIVAGKLMASMHSVILLLISSFPVMTLSFAYGGIHLEDLLFLFLHFLLLALLAASIGIFFSALCRKTTTATALSYGTITMLVGGTFGINQFIWSMANMGSSGYLIQVGGLGSQVNSGGFLYLLLLNPAVAFYQIIRSQTENQDNIASVIQWFGNRPSNLVLDNWILVSHVLWVAASALLLAAAVKRLSPRGRRWRGK